MDGLSHLEKRRLTRASCGPAQSPTRCTKCNSPSINDQCTNFILFDVALSLHSKATDNIQQLVTVTAIATKFSELIGNVSEITLSNAPGGSALQWGEVQDLLSGISCSKWYGLAVVLALLESLQSSI